MWYISGNCWQVGTVGGSQPPTITAIHIKCNSQPMTVKNQCIEQLVRCVHAQREVWGSIPTDPQQNFNKPFQGHVAVSRLATWHHLIGSPQTVHSNRKWTLIKPRLARWKGIFWGIFLFSDCRFHFCWMYIPIKLGQTVANLPIWHFDQNMISYSYGIYYSNHSQHQNQEDEIYATILVSTQSCNFEVQEKFMNSWSLSLPANLRLRAHLMLPKINTYNFLTYHVTSSLAHLELTDTHCHALLFFHFHAFWPSAPLIFPSIH